MAFNFVEELESNLFSSVYSGVTDPIGGWILSYLGAGGSDQDTQAIEDQLQQITNAIASAVTQIDQMITNLQLNNAVDDSQKASQPLSYPDLTTLMTDLQTVNNTMAGIDPPNTALNFTPGTQTYVQNVRFYSDQGATLTSIYDMFVNMQLALMTMMVELCHGGNGWKEIQNLSEPPSSPVPANYVGAAYCDSLYHKFIQQQKCLLPFPNGKIGYPGKLGLEMIVVDQTPPSGSMLCWGYQNVKAAANSVYPCNIPWAQAILSGEWSYRLPTFDELKSLGGQDMIPLGGATVTGSGFDFEPDVVNNGVPGNISLPCVAQEALVEGNWNKWYDSQSDQYLGWYCDLFFDVGSGRPARVKFRCDSETDAFSDILGASWVQIWETDSGGNPEGMGPGIPSVSNYMDAIFIYNLATTDPALEEPSTLEIVTDLGAGGPTTTMSLMGTFPSRVQPGGSTGSAQLDISEYAYWMLVDPNDDTAPIAADVAVISNNQPFGVASAGTLVPAGTILWGPNATADTQVKVVAYRRNPNAKPAGSQPPPNPTVSASTTITAGSAMTPMQVTPQVANLYVSQTVLANPTPQQAVTVYANVQVVYSDGSTSDPPTDADPISSANQDFTYTGYDTSICNPSTTGAGIFLVTGGNATGSFTIQASDGNLSTAATTIRVPKTGS